jgi:hypothetical protein
LLIVNSCDATPIPKVPRTTAKILVLIKPEKMFTKEAAEIFETAEIIFFIIRLLIYKTSKAKINKSWLK